jgi:hypothetical protein
MYSLALVLGLKAVIKVLLWGLRGKTETRDKVE